MLTNEQLRIRDVNTQLLEQLKRKREEHAALTTAEQHNLHVARDAHLAKVAVDEKRVKAAWDEINAARAQIDFAKNEGDVKSKELAVWQRRLELKELGLQDIETSLNTQSNETQERIRKYKTDMEERTSKLREDLEKVSTLLEKCEYSIHLL
jgi:hypothetical protein